MPCHNTSGTTEETSPLVRSKFYEYKFYEMESRNISARAEQITVDGTIEGDLEKHLRSCGANEASHD